MKATAVANSNIALVKYWGKKDAALKTPMNGNISVTLDGMQTKTTVEFGDFDKDKIILNGKETKDEEIQEQIDLIRKRAGIDKRVRFQSENNFPTAAGLASSASGLAALTMAVTNALGMELSKKELSILTRLGSGSASRSIEGGFVEWTAGSKADGSDSYGKQLFDEGYWPQFRIIVAVTSTKEKKIKSRAGMAQTLKTSPMYEGWLKTVDKDLDETRKAIKKKDIRAVGEVAQRNFLKMHATMITTIPPIIYWNPASVRLLHAIADWQDEGMQCWPTMDAGPQVKVICLEKDEKEISKRLRKTEGVEDVIVCRPGKGARLTDDHLF